MIEENLKKEINRNYNAKIYRLTTTLELKTNIVINQKKLEDQGLNIPSQRKYKKTFLSILN